MQIVVVSMMGKKTPLEVESSDTIGHVKKLYFEKEGTLSTNNE